MYEEKEQVKQKYSQAILPSVKKVHGTDFLVTDELRDDSEGVLSSLTAT